MSYLRDSIKLYTVTNLALHALDGHLALKLHEGVHAAAAGEAATGEPRALMLLLS